MASIGFAGRVRTDRFRESLRRAGEACTLFVLQRATNSLVACASPLYLCARGTPKQPDDLLHHRVVSYSFGIHAVYPSRKHLPAKTRRMVDFLVEAFRNPPWR